MGLWLAIHRYVLAPEYRAAPSVVVAGGATLHTQPLFPKL